MIQAGTDDAERLEGSNGADTLTGKKGNDTYVVDHSGDVVVELADEGIDTVETSITYTLGDHVENLIQTGTVEKAFGNALNNVMTGNASANTLWGYDGNDRLDGGLGADKMAGGAGDDTYYIDNADDKAYETLDGADTGGNDTVYASLTHALRIYVENLILTGSAIGGSGNASDNHITGNALANELAGDDGDDVLDGAGGADRMNGGEGDDTYYVDNAGDIILESAGNGTDTLYSSVSYVLGTKKYVQNMHLTGTADLSLTGNEISNRLYGNAGANVLNGGGDSDRLYGGAGNDTYYVDNSADRIYEYADQGSDIVYASVSYTLSSYVQDLYLTGGENIDATGNNSVNDLYGNAGNNLLNGGAGADKMAGGDGDDTYYIDNTGDKIVEKAGEGRDVAFASVSYTIGLKVYIQELTLTGTADLNATGNNSYNTLTGNSGANVLTGLDGDDVLDGGAGADILIGGLGSDTYYIDSLSDVVTELAGEGDNDEIRSAVTYVLAEGSAIEHVGLYGSADINATGNSGNNILRSNAGINVLTGLGGDDTYYVDNAGDTVVEAAGGGYDIVYVDFSYTLGAVGSVEEVRLGGTGNHSLTGDASTNLLYGNAGNNVLDGGAGADIMTGGAGNDTYYFDNVGDKAVEVNFGGEDEIRVGFSYTLASKAYVETVTLTGSDNINATGNSIQNFLNGNAGNNVLNGKGGADILTGGLGDDSYYVDFFTMSENYGDKIIEKAGEGADTVYSSVSYNVANFVEYVYLTGSADLELVSTTSASLFGNAGNNKLTATSGALSGGLGNDSYYVGAGTAVIAELAGEGTDTVFATGTYALAANAEVEVLTLLGTGAFNLTGSDFANTLNGNSANNQLNGGGGADIMIGGAGSDQYYIDNAGDRIVETQTGGRDSAVVSFTFVIAEDMLNVESWGLSGSDNLNLTGNSENNQLTGNSGKNVLDGGVGADFMAGFAGNDTYYVDNVEDVIQETAGQGTDTVFASVTYELGSNVNIQVLELTGTADINGYGNQIANKLIGNTGSNLLSGGGGNDTLTGGGGNDIFQIGWTEGTETITDYSDDLIWILGAPNGVELVITQVGNDVTIDLGFGGVITILDTMVAELDGNILA